MGDPFGLKKQRTSAGTEIRAGITTFLMMAYIIVVNPAILSKCGMPFSGVLFATVLVCAFSSMAMGLFANLPYAVAPGMGINAFFAFSLVIGMGMSWQTALGAVFLSGVVFIVLSLTGVRTEIVKAIPDPLRLGLAAGIGIFLALIGLQSVGFVVASPETLVTYGKMNATLLLFAIGLLVTSVMLLKRVRGALTIGILITSALAVVLSSVGTASGWLDRPLLAMPKEIFALPSLEVFFSLDIRSALSIGMIMPIFSLLFVDLFDSIASFVGIAQVAGLVEEDGTPTRIGRALLVDAGSTTISGLFGTSSGTVYVESAAGIEEGGRTGLTAVVAGLMFLPFMFLSPLLTLIPEVATAPVLVLVGVFMARPLMSIDWTRMEDAIPAFLATILIPLTYSITQGVIWGCLIHTAIKLALGKAREVHWMLYIVDVFAVFSLCVPLFE